MHFFRNSHNYEAKWGSAVAQHFLTRDTTSERPTPTSFINLKPEGRLIEWPCCLAALQHLSFVNFFFKEGQQTPGAGGGRKHFDLTEKDKRQTGNTETYSQFTRQLCLIEFMLQDV